MSTDEPQPVTLVPPLAEQLKKAVQELPPAPFQHDPPLPATTTSEQDLKSAGQRQINRTWEYTQAAIALITVASAIAYSFLTLYIRPPDTTSAVFFASSFSLVIGFYFSRTNHARIGDEPARQSGLDTRKSGGLDSR